jgi:drug/metabolite transporter (DMT)-like permease
MSNQAAATPAPRSASEESGESLSSRLAVPLALIALYVVWSSTYLGIRFAVESIPPYFMGGIRFVIAGAVLYVFLRLRGAPNPSLREWGGAAIVGTLLLAGGNGMVAFAEQSVDSGLAAILIATIPLWAALFASLWSERPGRPELLGLGLGFIGVGLLNTGSSLSGHPLPAAILILAAIVWAFGSMWGRHLPMPRGVMASAAEMLTGGAMMLAIGGIRGEHFNAFPTARSIWAVVYLIVFGSFVGYSSYVFLLQRTRPALATSYAYVSPVGAVILGVILAGEKITGVEIVAMFVVLAAVALVLMGRKK